MANPVLKNLGTKFNNPQDYDVVFRVQGQAIYAHLRYLALFSKTFRQLAKIQQMGWCGDGDGGSVESNEIVINDFSSFTFYAYLQFLYTGEIEITHVNFEQLYDISHCFFDASLRKRCEAFMDKLTMINRGCEKYEDVKMCKEVRGRYWVNATCSRHRSFFDEQLKKNTGIHMTRSRNKLIRRLITLFDEPDQSDLMLVVGGQRIYVHLSFLKIVISSDNKLYDYLTQNMNDNATVIMDSSYNYHTMHTYIRFQYSGEYVTRLQAKELTSLLQLACYFNDQLMIAICQETINSRLMDSYMPDYLINLRHYIRVIQQINLDSMNQMLKKWALKKYKDHILSPLHGLLDKSAPYVLQLAVDYQMTDLIQLIQQDLLKFLTRVKTHIDKKTWDFNEIERFHNIASSLNHCLRLMQILAGEVRGKNLETLFSLALLYHTTDQCHMGSKCTLSLSKLDLISFHYIAVKCGFEHVLCTITKAVESNLKNNAANFYSELAKLNNAIFTPVLEQSLCRVLKQVEVVEWATLRSLVTTARLHRRLEANPELKGRLIECAIRYSQHSEFTQNEVINALNLH